MNAKSSFYKTFDPLVAVAAAFLYFFTVRDYVPGLVYFVIAAFLTFYFFPIKYFLFNQKETEQKWTFIHAISDPLFSLIFALSVVSLYIPEGDNIFRYAIALTGIANGLLIWYHYFAGSSKYFVATHFCFAFLTAGMISG